MAKKTTKNIRERTLITLLRSLILRPALNSPIISNLAGLTVFDEMAIKPGLQYNSKLDCIDGYNWSAKVARQAIVFSAQEILEEWLTTLVNVVLLQDKYAK
ncbi:hypothetical protein J437_LFUL008268 [Ladona fulva]|uniref:Uncharacterized protein n=1 Tax=Ladona fulva TaxID=123851 RepID=A0A8K0K7N3_LADFU|nr:hypothetical protein J437_LFUL008268 [Ladona fulva]